MLAADLLHDAPEPASITAGRRTILAVLHQVAARLGNTVAICRKCYVHPGVLDAFEAGRLRWRKHAEKSDALRPEEAATLRFLRRYDKAG